ncbi:hypothetical protein SEA_VERITY_66 [Gordonia phage Verity]|uniref:Uncharacterized protein n=1 Tax=Gordonia phage Verity TaxID=2591211 RepID=A0A514DIX0_9CAUD|nr:hypothetical protein J1776_gp66 [Gordonia phage Verity]QDH93552.1 hypothetical protein SEA_VERITY_66 [Gordonia phage Verity]QPO16909.1 hypothetical protein SEA_DELREY21_66 [Gordonia phage Delrey21]QXN74192.1 hypothetical protein SEA_DOCTORFROGGO_66 [Gordonia phage DoctorFroggo]
MTDDQPHPDMPDIAVLGQAEMMSIAVSAYMSGLANGVAAGMGEFLPEDTVTERVKEFITHALEHHLDEIQGIVGALFHAMATEFTERNRE